MALGNFKERKGDYKMSKKILKKLVVACCVSVMTASILGGCGKTVSEDKKATSSESKKEQKSAILVVSFGTSYNDSRNITIVPSLVWVPFPFMERQLQIASHPAHIPSIQNGRNQGYTGYFCQLLTGHQGITRSFCSPLTGQDRVMWSGSKGSLAI